MKAPGRNTPCPCGSGLKYKKCCLHSSASSTSTSTSTTDDVMADVRAALQDEEFENLEDMNTFLNTLMQQGNAEPAVSFEGLSPDQMHQLMHQPFDSPDTLYFNPEASTDKHIPIMHLLQLLTDAIGEKGLKPTATGNLPRNACRQIALDYWGEEKYVARMEKFNIRSEIDFFDLHVVRLVANETKLIRKYKGKFIITQKYRKLLRQPANNPIYPMIFRSYCEVFNWEYRMRTEEIPLIQQTFAYTLYLLQKFGHKPHPHSFYEDRFLAAFPAVINYVDTDNPYFSAKKSIRRQYTWLSMVHFAKFLGLATAEPTNDSLFCHDYVIHSLPLLYQFVEFRFPATSIQLH